MTYSATYDSDDVAPVLIDGGTKVLVQMGAFATIFGLLVAAAIGAYFWRKAKK